MTTIEVKLNLPDQVALEAQRAGLLSDQAIGRLIEEAVRREAGKRLLDAMARLCAQHERRRVRLVVDTNVVVSGLLWLGNPGRLLEAAALGQVTLYTSPA